MGERVGARRGAGRPAGDPAPGAAAGAPARRDRGHIGRRARARPRRVRRGAEPVRVAGRVRGRGRRASGAGRPRLRPERRHAPADRHVRRLAHASRAGPAAPRPAGRAHPRRADEPPRHRQRDLAGGHPLLLSRCHPVRQPRQGLHRRRRRAGGGAGRRDGHRVRRWLRGVRGGPRGAPGPDPRAGRPPEPGHRPRGALRGALPLQGHQGPAGPESHQDAGEAGAHRGPGPPHEGGAVRLPSAPPVVPAGGGAEGRHRGLRRDARAARRQLRARAG